MTPDGAVTMAPLEAIEKQAAGISQSLILCGHTHVARAVRLGDGRLVVNPGSVGGPGYSYNVPYPHVVEAGTPDARYAILELIVGTLERDLPARALRQRGDGGIGAPERRRGNSHPRWRPGGSGSPKQKRPASAGRFADLKSKIDQTAAEIHCCSFAFGAAPT